MNNTPQQTTGKAPNSGRSGWAAGSARGSSGPCSNTGRKAPCVEKAFVDWIGISFLMPEGIDYPESRADSISDAAKEILGDFVADVFGFYQFEPTGGGWSGYLHRYKIGPNGEFGWLSFGGAAQKRTVNVQITGTGCAAIKDWASVIFWGKGIDQHQNIDPAHIKITRLDLAHDDVEAANIDIERAKTWYHDGGFTTSGRPPSSSLFDDMDSGAGKTFYVGKRENGKLLRVYEKGKQLGDPTGEWVRAECEFRAKDRWIPWDAVESPAKDLAASYPALDWISKVKAVIKTVRKAAEITYHRMMSWLNRQCGPAIWAATQINGGDISEVFEKVARSKWPPRLQQFRHKGHDLEGLATCN